MFKELVNELMSQYANGDWQSVLIISVSILAGSLIVHFISFKILKRFSKKSDKPFLKILSDKLNKPSLGLILAISLSVIFLAFAPDNQLVDTFLHYLGDYPVHKIGKGYCFTSI